MLTIRKVGNWEFFKDEITGVTAFTNPVLNFQSNWNTGTDAEEEIEAINKMSDSEFKEYAIELIPNQY